MNNKLIAKFSNELEIGIVKLNPSTMKMLSLENSDYCEIIGKKAHYSMVFADKFVKDNEIHLDLVGIKNLGVKENDSVIINPIKKLPVCKKATLIPLENKSYEKYRIHLSLRGFAIAKGMYLGILNHENSLEYFYVSEVIPEKACIINDTTELTIKSRLKNNFEGVLYEDIGGLKKELKTIRDIIELQLLHPDIFKKLGVKPIRGILLHGPPGTGKTLIAKAIATETNAYFIGINAPELLSKYVGESEENLKNIFKLAKENSPSIIFIDEIDAIAQKREDSSDVERRLVAELLTLMDGIESNQGIVVIGATNRIDSIDEALRRPGRFDKEIEIPIPDENSRIEILEIHTRNMPLHKDVNIKELAKICYGFTGADMEALCKEAAMNALNRIIQNSNDYSLSSNISIEVTMDDFTKALNLIEPSALREITSELPYATWNDFGGMKNILEDIKQIIEYRLFKTKELNEMGIEVPKGILVYGQHGTGKTLLARVIAHSTNANFIYVNCNNLLSKYVGEGEKLVRRIFAKARNASPSIIFLDSIDTLKRKNVSILRQIGNEIDNMKEDILVIGTSNLNPKKLPGFILNENKFSLVYEFRLPDINERKEILDIYLRKLKNHNVDLEKIAKVTNGFTGAMLKSLIIKAQFNALKRNKFTIDNSDICNVLKEYYGILLEE